MSYLGDGKAVIALIEQHGLFGLGGSDGCECVNFSLHGFDVSVSCHKSEHTIRVSCHVMDFDPQDLIRIATDVQSRLTSGYRVRYCSYEDDHSRVERAPDWDHMMRIKEARCCYCGAHRVDEKDYLCEACKERQDARSSFPSFLVG